jgi:hypothetical protein
MERTLSVDMRPSSFDQFIGNEKVIKYIQSMVKTGHIPTALMFSGPTGVGKTTLARLISKSLDGDLMEVNASDDTGVDKARSIAEDSMHKPLFGKYRIILLDEAHQLSKQAQNALLKHVEDAPSSTIWILCTTEPNKIIPTLRGRCLSFQFGGLNAEDTRTLVRRGLEFLGKASVKEDELVKTLVHEGVSAPRTILMALERYLGGMDPLGAVLGAEGSPLGLEIARGTVKKDWGVVSKLLAKASADEAISIRNIVAGYFKAIMLKVDDRGACFASEAIIELGKDFPTDTGMQLALLSARLYNICERSL